MYMTFNLLDFWWEGYSDVKDQRAQAAYQPRQLLEEKYTIHRIEEDTNTISDVAEDG